MTGGEPISRVGGDTEHIHRVGGGRPYRPVMASFTPALKRLVWERDGGRCCHCGRAAYDADIHHRRGRGMGGRDAGEEWINHHSNLLTLCRACHNWVEANPVAARRTGYRLDAGQVPDEVPVRCWDGGWVVLHGEDYRTPCSPPPLVLGAPT